MSPLVKPMPSVEGGDDHCPAGGLALAAEECSKPRANPAGKEAPSEKILPAADLADGVALIPELGDATHAPGLSDAASSQPPSARSIELAALVSPALHSLGVASVGAGDGVHWATATSASIYSFSPRPVACRSSPRHPCSPRQHVQQNNAQLGVSTRSSANHKEQRSPNSSAPSHPVVAC